MNENGTPENLKPFPKGVSGNPGGRPKTKHIRDALWRRLVEADPAELGELIDAMVVKAKSGDVQAFNSIADRLDGKVPQKIAGDDEESPVNVLHEIRRTIVKP